MRWAASPATKGRNCQKVSPVPARLRPWMPWARLAATRRASSTRRGMRWARVSALSVSLRPGERALSDRTRTRAMMAILTCQPGGEAADEIPDGLPVGAGREGQRHAVLEHRLGQRHHIGQGGGDAALNQGAGAHGEHQRLAGAGTRAPEDL